MFPSEMVILMAIAVNRGPGRKPLAYPMDVTGEYIGYLYDSLVSRGYLKGSKSRGYQLTSMGRQSLLEFLRENEIRVKDVVGRLKQLGIEYNREVAKIGNEAIKVK